MYTFSLPPSLPQSFIIKSIERNIDCVYIARQTILDVACSSASRPAQLPLHPQPGIQTMEQIEELSGKKNWKKFFLEFKFCNFYFLHRNVIIARCE